jgi:hypothetical protein
LVELFNALVLFWVTLVHEFEVLVEMDGTQAVQLALCGWLGSRRSACRNMFRKGVIAE